MADVAVLFTPAAELAVLQSDPNASPPLLEAGFAVGLPKDAADVDDAYEGVSPGRAIEADVVVVGNGWLAVIGTDVK